MASEGLLREVADGLNGNSNADSSNVGASLDAPATAEPTAVNVNNGVVAVVTLLAPSPAEVAAHTWASIEEVSRRKHCPAVRSLHAFLRDHAHPYITAKGDNGTNIIDQGDKVTYNMPPDIINKLFGHLNECYAAGYPQHMSERQGTPLNPRSGIMYDFDIISTHARPALSERHYHRLTSSFAARLTKDIDIFQQLSTTASQLSTGRASAAGRPATEYRFLVFYIIKTAAVELSADRLAQLAKTPTFKDAAGAPLPVPQCKLYKYGLHALIPALKVTRSYKKWSIRELEKDPAIAAVMADLGAAGNTQKCLDTGSASVPTLFLGSCKSGGTPYSLGAVYEVLIDAADAAASGSAANAWSTPPMVRKLPPAEYEGYNLVHEMSLNYEAPAPPHKEAPLVQKLELECRDEIRSHVEDWGARSQGGAVATVATEHELSELTARDAEARLLHAVLDLLPQEFCTVRNQRRDIIYALANTSDAYKPIAEWFFQKNPAKWLDGGEMKLDVLWDEAVRRRGAGGEGQLSKRSILHWAKAANPQRYAKVMESSYFTILTRYVYDYSGNLEHYMVSKVLHSMLATKFIVDVTYGVRGGMDYVWYEFVTPSDAMAPGEVWKWRKETDPDSLQVYISEGLSPVMTQIADHLEERQARAESEEQAKYYKEIIRAFKCSHRRLFNDIFKAGIIRQARPLFRRRGFAADLDQNGRVRGVLNGVIVLGPTTQFINHFHEYLVSKYTKVCYKVFDPRTPMVRTVLDAFESVIPEPDAREKMLMFFAQSLNGLTKEGWMLIWDGGGQNGKTTILRAVAKAIGDHYAKKFSIQIFVCEAEAADKPNSAFMVFKGVSYGYCEETNKAERLNTARLKQIVSPGEATGRDLNQKQETFTMTCNVVAATQFYFIIETADHGTWRRIGRYRSKVRFRKNPDPNNPYERKDDQRFVRSLPDDPEYQSAVLAVLVHYYERLEREFGGEIKNVRSPTIERETEEYRISQDATHRFISERVVLSPITAQQLDPTPIAAVAGAYIEWYHANVDTKKLAPGVIVKDLENSILSKYLRPGLNRQMSLMGCRVLPAADAPMEPGEMFISEHELRGFSTVQDDQVAPLNDAEALKLAMEQWGPEWWAARAPVEPMAVECGAVGMPTGTPVAAECVAITQSMRADNLAASDEWEFCNDDADILLAEQAMAKNVETAALAAALEDATEGAGALVEPAGPVIIMQGINQRTVSTDDLYCD
jgi:hypothetical protein